MSVFDSLSADVGWGALSGLAGRPITYIEPGKDDKVITGVVSPLVKSRRRDAEFGRTLPTERVVQIGKDESDAVRGGVADPKVTASVKIDGIVWSVAHVEHVSAASVKLHLVRSHMSEVTERGYRGG